VLYLIFRRAVSTDSGKKDTPITRDARDNSVGRGTLDNQRIHLERKKTSTEGVCCYPAVAGALLYDCWLNSCFLLVSIAVAVTTICYLLLVIVNLLRPSHFTA
jgi:hypothetical protein